jgi:hypothetical protein
MNNLLFDGPKETMSIGIRNIFNKIESVREGPSKKTIVIVRRVTKIIVGTFIS